VTVARKQLLGVIPDPFLRGIGLVVSQWAWTEAIIDQYIWRLLGTRPERGRIVTSNFPARAKIDLLAALMRKSKMSEMLVKKIEKDGEKLAAQRNLVVHGCLAVPPQLQGVGIAVSYIARRGKLKDRSRHVTPELLERLAGNIASFTAFMLAQDSLLPKQRGSGEPPPKRNYSLKTFLKRFPPVLEVDAAED
jgi:hypothetical protein